MKKKTAYVLVYVSLKFKDIYSIIIFVNILDINWVFDECFT